MKETMKEALNALDAGDWDRAHDLTQADPSPEAAWVHAHLHRVEGDETNARYWYARAGQEPFDGSLDAERKALRAKLA